MGASRKLQGEIDRVLKKVQEGVDLFDSIWNKVYDTENANQKEKFEADLKKEIKKLQRYRDQIKTWIQSSEIKDKKVSASYEQALMDARKLIEREMERFKVCEKETKTKAFSKEGLGQQPKTDPKEKAKSETRDWLNNVVGDMESQIDNFEAEVEGLTVKKGKTRPPRLVHLETSIVRHKAHILKLELILRLLDNDELSPEQVNDIKDFLEDYVERNQDDFDEFSNVDDLYNTLPLDKVEALEDMVALGASGLVKGVGSVSTASSALGLKSSLATLPAQSPASMASTAQLGTSVQDQIEETTSQDSNSDVVPKTPTSKIGGTTSSVSSTTLGVGSAPVVGHSSAPPSGSTSARGLVGGPTAAAVLSGSGSVRGVVGNAAATIPSSLVSTPSSAKEEDNSSFPSRQPSPAIGDTGIDRGVGRESTVGVSNQPTVSSQMSFNSSSGVPGNGAPRAVSPVPDIAKRNNLAADERIGSGLVQPLVSPLSNRTILQQVPKSNDGNGSTDSNNPSEGSMIGGRVFSPSMVSGLQWRPQSSATFQNQSELGQFRGRTEIAPDQREKFLQRFQQVQQQGHSNVLGVSSLSGANQKQFSLQQQNPLLQQFNSQSTSPSPQVGLGIGVQSPSPSNVTSSASQQSFNHQASQHPFLSTGFKDADVNHVKADDQQQQQQQTVSDDLNTEPATSSSLNKSLVSEDDVKAPYTPGGSATLMEANQVHRDTDLSPGQPMQSNQPPDGLGVIGRRSVSELGAIGDNLSGSALNYGGMHDQKYNLQMLQAAYHKRPQSTDSERPKAYYPAHPAATPPSYPQSQAPIVDNPAFWKRLGADDLGTDTLFFAFYYQQNTYQQYMAARELKNSSWRFHKKYNTWFQRHEQPKITNDEYEKGTYLFFDFHIGADGGLQQGWRKRIQHDFTFEYGFLEDEMAV
ncbi:hypothetical protein QJS04_geneDACA009457 [Acorus gramineus]|uniref:CCR4-NOT transcription complex subunit 3 n=1 Tax=Acorus gramineus TaxID=55184 RepID=A0AAV9AJJ9_ACOGR|nr:hypothetical protein QJS04_geneDACA009457 [Acorus gramineus]